MIINKKLLQLGNALEKEGYNIVCGTEHHRDLGYSSHEYICIYGLKEPQTSLNIYLYKHRDVIYADTDNSQSLYANVESHEAIIKRLSEIVERK